MWPPMFHGIIKQAFRFCYYTNFKCNIYLNGTPLNLDWTLTATTSVLVLK